MADAPEAAYGDTNMFVALFAMPDHTLHERALGLFRRVADGELAIILTGVVVAELCFVASRVLGWTRRQTADRLGALLEAEGLIVPDSAVLKAALDVFGGSRRLAFPDAYLAASAVVVGPAAVATFDMALARYPGLRSIGS